MKRVAVTPRAAAPAAAGAAAELHAKRRIQAWVWGAYIVGVISFYAWVTVAVVPRPPADMGFNWAPWSSGGIGLAAMAKVLGLAAGMTVAVLAFQELVWRKALDGSPNATERIFFASSLAARALFLGTLAWHHFGPGSEDAAAVGDGGHRTFLFSAWYAAYAADLWQLMVRPKHFSRAFVGLMVPHHFLSLAWFGLWMLTLAPRDVGGAPIWNTAIIYLCGCIPNHLFKLWTTYQRPKWAGFLVGPATMCHWAILLASQGYYFSQCPCSSWGCWYPGSIIMLVGAWGMAAFDLKFFMGGIVISTSPLLGAKIMIEEIPSLLFASAPPAGTPLPSEPSSPTGSEHSLIVAAAPAAASARWTEEDAAELAQRLAEAAEGDVSSTAPRVSVELLLRAPLGLASGKAAAPLALTNSAQLKAVAKEE